MLKIFLIILIIPPPIPAQDISPPPGCTISCCMNCKVDYNCKICYNLNKDDTDACPCLEDLSPRQLVGLKIGNKGEKKEKKEEAELLNNSETKLPKSSPLRSSIGRGDTGMFLLGLWRENCINCFYFRYFIGEVY